jgi:DNA-binding protein HU-beta
MNKTQLVDALAARIGDRRTAATAVDGLLETIVETVRAGDSVSLTGFGVFESRARAARTARNPRTGDTISVPATTVPAFRPGAGFRTAVGGSAAPRTTPTRRTTAAAAAPVEEAPAKPARKAGKAKSNGSFAADAPATKPAEKPAKAKSDKAAKADKGKKGKKGKKNKKA